MPLSLLLHATVTAATTLDGFHHPLPERVVQNPSYHLFRSPRWYWIVLIRRHIRGGAPADHEVEVYAVT